MTTNIIECYDAQHWDGGERHNHHAYLVDENDAKAVAGQHGLVIKRTFVIHDTLADYQNHKSDDLKRKALAKLTKEERIVLGLE